VVIVRYGDWDIYWRLSNNLTTFFFLSFPYFWLAILLVLLGVAISRIRRSRGSYRFALLSWLFFAIFFITVNGLVFYYSGVGRYLENYLADNYPLYRKVNYLRGAWDNSEKGLLSGEIKEISASNLSLIDFSGVIWQVDFSQARLADHLSLQPEKKIKIIGSIVDENSFQANEIRAWECGCPHCASLSGAAHCSSCQNGSCADTCQMMK